MTEAFNQHEEDDPLEEMKDLTAQWANYFNGIQRVAALASVASCRH